MRNSTSVNVKVAPDLEKVVAAAQEAQIAIEEIYFIRNVETDILEALSISVDGKEESKGYFTWLLDKLNLSTETVA